MVQGAALDARGADALAASGTVSRWRPRTWRERAKFCNDFDRGRSVSNAREAPPALGLRLTASGTSFRQNENPARVCLPEVLPRGRGLGNPPSSASKLFLVMRAPLVKRVGAIEVPAEPARGAPALYSLRSNSFIRTNDAINGVTLKQLRTSIL
jgi:hypothetical protein